MLDQIVEDKNGYFYEKDNYNILGKKDYITVIK